MKPVVDDTPFEFMNSNTLASCEPKRAVAVTSNDDASPREFDVLQIALRYKSLLLIGLLGGLGLGQIAFLKRGPEYNAVAQIVVSRRAQVPVRDEMAQAWEDRAEHISIIKSPLIVDKAIARGKLNDLPTLNRSVDPVEDILECLEVKRTAGQDSSFLNVFELKFRNTQRADARAVVNAMILAYRDYLKESQEEITGELSQQITRLNEELSQAIEQKQQELIDFRKEAPLQWRTAPGDRRQPGDVTNVHQERIVEIERARTQDVLRRTEINGKIKALENAIDQGQSREELENLVRLLMATTQSGAGLGAAGAAAVATTPLDGTHATQAEQASAQVLLLILEEQKLLRDYSDDHPDVQNVRKSIARVQQFYEARGVPLPELAGRDVPGQKTDVVGGYLQFLKQQVEELDNKDAELTRLYETESKNVKEVVKFMVEDQSRSEELERLKAQWTATVNNVSQLDMTRENKGYTPKLLAPVREEWSVKRYLKIVGGVTACLLGLCAGLVFLRKWRDMTVK